MSIEIISPGPLTTVQDQGRFKNMKWGFSQSGVMDWYSASLANILVDNSPLEGVLEMTLMGITARFNTSCVVAITGGDVSPKIDGKEIEMCTAVQVKKGSVLNMSGIKDGLRAYLAISGGIACESVMNSLSTNLKCQIGGYKGRKLLAGDVLKLACPQETLYQMNKRHLTYAPPKNEEIFLRAVLGPQEDYFTEKGIETFFSASFTVTPTSDRMGIKLDGESIEAKSGVDIISDGIALGSVQVPSSGKPIIMMADRQTTGGYAKIATVITADIPFLAQAKPNQRVKFEKVSVEQAQRILKKKRKELDKISNALLLGMKIKQKYCITGE